MLTCKAKDLQLADVISLSANPGPYSFGTVKQIKDGIATIFRPYVHTEDFSYTGGVICYVGIEEYQIWLDGNSDFYVWERKELR